MNCSELISSVYVHSPPFVRRTFIANIITIKNKRYEENSIFIASL